MKLSNLFSIDVSERRTEAKSSGSCWVLIFLRWRSVSRERERIVFATDQLFTTDLSHVSIASIGNTLLIIFTAYIEDRTTGVSFLFNEYQPLSPSTLRNNCFNLLIENFFPTGRRQNFWNQMFN